MTAPDKPIEDGTENILKFAKRAKPCPDCKRTGYVTRYPGGLVPCATCKGIGVVDGVEPQDRVLAALSGGRDDRWERMWKEFKNTMVAFKSHGTVTYEAVLETMNEMESMSAKEGE